MLTYMRQGYSEFGVFKVLLEWTFFGSEYEKKAPFEKTAIKVIDITVTLDVYVMCITR